MLTAKKPAVKKFNNSLPHLLSLSLSHTHIHTHTHTHTHTHSLTHSALKSNGVARMGKSVISSCMNIFLCVQELRVNLFCFSDIDDCVDLPCLNGGTCSDGVNSFTCKCVADFKGSRCELSTGKYFGLIICFHCNQRQPISQSYFRHLTDTLLYNV